MRLFVHSYFILSFLSISMKVLLYTSIIGTDMTTKTTMKFSPLFFIKSMDGLLLALLYNHLAVFPRRA